MLEHSPLGKKSEYETLYNPQLLFPLPRKINRSVLGIDNNHLGFYGVDIWNHYEISWLNAKGKPNVAIGEIIYPASSPNIIESKSMKLYFNSFNGTTIKTIEHLIDMVQNDLSLAVGEKVIFKLFDVAMDTTFNKFSGICLDNLDIECNKYQPHPNYLSCYSDQIVTQMVYSNLLKSNCAVTSQADWGSVYIEYTGKQIDHVGLLKYIISLRNHNEFHEQCIERIFFDITNKCQPNALTVYARYTRRGGIDINPYRTTNKDFKIPNNQRLIRQ